MWRPRLEDSEKLKYLGIVGALEADIRLGRVLPGDRLPPQRSIALALGVDLTTVTRAFNEARRRGLVAAQAGRGTFVREIRAGGALPPVLDLSMNIPPQPEDPDLRQLLPQSLAALLASPQGALSLHYQESRGVTTDRVAAAHWLTASHGEQSPERVVVTAGAQAALFALCGLIVGRGGRVAAGEVTYPGLKAAALQHGCETVPLAMDAGGIIPGDFARTCAENPPKALYLIPNIDNPTTATLSLARRQSLISTARQYGVALIEDDPYGPLLSDRLPSFLSLAPDITWHVATLSKCATPALRVAWVATPGSEHALQLAAVLRASVLMAPPLFAALASRWSMAGQLARIASAIRTENMVRQQIAARIFATRHIAAAPEGHHLWLTLPAGWRAADFAGHADRAGVSIVPAESFATGSKLSEAVRISLGVAPDRDVLEEGLQQLAALLERPGLTLRTVV